MADPNARDAKLIQYLNEAYGKEKQLETSLQAHIAMTTRPPYKKRLQQHLKETKAHSKGVERRIKKLGGQAETLSLPGPDAVTGAAQTAQNVANRAAALAQGPLHAARGTGEQERLLKNAKTEYSDEAEEIATYTAIQALADTVGDRETAVLARGILREEERMARFLEKLIPTLTKAVSQEEIPAPLRKPARRRARSKRSSGAGASGSKRTASSAQRRSGGGASGTKRRSGGGASGTKRSSSRSGSRSGAPRAGGSRAGGSRSGGSRARSRTARSR